MDVVLSRGVIVGFLQVLLWVLGLVFCFKDDFWGFLGGIVIFRVLYWFRGGFM